MRMPTRHSLVCSPCGRGWQATLRLACHYWQPLVVRYLPLADCWLVLGNVPDAHQARSGAFTAWCTGPWTWCAGCWAVVQSRFSESCAHYTGQEL